MLNKIQFEPDKTPEATKTVTTVEDALESIKSIEQSITEQIDDIGEPEQPVRRSVCFDQAQDEKKAAIINERVWDKNYDDTIMLCKYYYDFIFNQNNDNLIKIRNFRNFHFCNQPFLAFQKSVYFDEKSSSDGNTLIIIIFVDSLVDQ